MRPDATRATELVLVLVVAVRSARTTSRARLAELVLALLTAATNTTELVLALVTLRLVLGVL